MSNYIPTPAYYDRMPIDISFVFKNERPASKHGFLKVDGGNFRFEDGYYIGKVPATYADGVMKFHVGTHFPASYFLIVKE